MKHLLGLAELSSAEITQILDLAREMKAQIEGSSKKSSSLFGKSIVNLFYENSTRTRLSFELAGNYLSADVANIAAAGSSVAKGESLIDTAKTVDAMAVDVIVIRHQNSGAAKLVAENVGASVINAGDGMNEHPTQALLDMFTIRERKGEIAGLKVAIVGDIAHSRVARSNIYGLTKMGANVALCAPRTLVPPGIEQLSQLPGKCEIFSKVENAVREADVIMTLRIQQERLKSALFPSLSEYARWFGINDERLALAKPDAIVLHPGPANRGVEITSAVADCELSVIGEQVTNGVAIRMAVLKQLTMDN